MSDNILEYLHYNQGWIHFESGLISYVGSTGTRERAPVDKAGLTVIENPAKNDLLHIAGHEQYQWPFPKNVVPDNYERCATAFRFVLDRGYQPIWIEDGSLAGEAAQAACGAACHAEEQTRSGECRFRQVLDAAYPHRDNRIIRAPNPMGQIRMTCKGVYGVATVLFLLTTTCLSDTSADGPKEPGIYLNLSADAVLIDPRWKHAGQGVSKEQAIDRCSKEEIIEALNQYVDSYIGTQVLGLFLNINYQRACFDSQVMESYWELPDPESEITGWPRLHWAVKKKGVDPFDVCIKRCRRDKIEPWISIRMNDHHYFDIPARINSLWLEHPEYRTRPPHGLFNYAKQEVRDYYKAFIEEVLNKYDVDGIELDWMRTQHLFPDGQQAQGIKRIDQFMREIRDIAEAQSRQRGHPIRIAARVPARPEIGRHFGLDAAGWAQDGTVDMLILTNWFTPTNFDLPIELWKREIGDQSRCIVAAGADATFCVSQSKFVKQMQAEVETMRGFAVSAYHRGADAIYIFNNFLSPYKVKVIGPDGSVSYTESEQQTLREIGKLSTSLGKPRKHVLTYTEPDIEPVPREPRALPPGVASEFKIPIGPKPAKGRCVIHIGLDSQPGFDDARLTVKLNGVDCMQTKDLPRDPRYQYDNTKVWHVVKSVAETGARVMRYEADVEALTDGYNRIGITNDSKNDQALTWLELYLR